MNVVAQTVIFLDSDSQASCGNAIDRLVMHSNMYAKYFMFYCYGFSATVEEKPSTFCFTKL
jgi:hypothetical protein